jgi:hypothetical protein
MQQEFYYVECRLLTTMFRFQLRLPMITINIGFRSGRDTYMFCHYVFENNREYQVAV